MERKYIALDELLKFPIRIDHYDEEHGNVHFVYGVESVLEWAQDLPATDVAEVKRGTWQVTDTPFGKCCICSVCGGCPTMEYNFCPYCGARMVD